MYLTSSLFTCLSHVHARPHSKQIDEYTQTHIITHSDTPHTLCDHMTTLFSASPQPQKQADPASSTSQRCLCPVHDWKASWWPSPAVPSSTRHSCFHPARLEHQSSFWMYICYVVKIKWNNRALTFVLSHLPKPNEQLKGTSIFPFAWWLGWVFWIIWMMRMYRGWEEECVCEKDRRGKKKHNERGRDCFTQHPCCSWIYF